jgi:hypothetical protein
MSLLPKINLPTYTINLPVSKQQVKIKPYTVKEQKLLLMATESGDKNFLVDTILQIVNNCIVNPIDARELPITDVEYVFYQLRARSQSEIVNLRYKCENKVDGNICGNIMTHDLNLLTDLEISEPLSPTIELDNKIGIKLKHQKFEKDKLETKNTPTPEELFELIAANIEFIYDEKSSYSPKDVPIENVIEFLGELNTKQYEKIEEFFLNEPKIYKNLQITCKKCGTVHNITVEDIFDFFI